jgi:LPXTG-site transpeptidase (sortase) family protein
MTVLCTRTSRMAAVLALIGLALAVVGAVLLQPWGNEDPPTTDTVRELRPTVPVPAAPAPTTAPVRGARPVRIEIPEIDVAAPVVPVVAVDGVLTPPDDVRVVGWWTDGGRPGDTTGTTLLTGHTFSRGDGVFDRLGELTPGARVRVATAHGTLRYRVEDVTAYSRGRLADRAPSLFGASAGPRLVLTTCSGYDGEHYRTTTVVRAVPVEPVE